MKESNQKAKKKEDLKAIILETAKQLFLHNGFESTSIRNIATKIGYSPTTIYLYYKDKSDIVYSLHQEGFSLLRTHLTALTTVEDPFERLKALGRSYLIFAKNNPDFYELMFIHKAPMTYIDSESETELWIGGRQLYSFIVATIEECKQKGYFFDGDSNFIALQAWGMVHGLCSLFITTRLQKIAFENFDVASSTTLLDETFNTYVRFIENTRKIN